MMFGVNAQYLLQEGFNTGSLPTGWTTQDSDGDGYTWDATFLYQSSDATHSGDGMIASASYINNIGALTPDNWLISPAVTITAAANLTFWVKGQDASYAAEHYSVYVATSNTIAAFTATTAVLSSTTTGDWVQQTVNLASYVGQTIYIAFRHHNTTDMYWLDLDDVEVFAQPTDPTIVAAPTTVNFGSTILGNTADATVTVTTYNLTTGVTATTAAPFAVSADGTTYGTTATVAATGGTLNVRYTPTTAVADNGTITLASTGATNVTVTLTGTGIDCNGATIPYTCDFTDSGQLLCWEIEDANNDGNTFEYSNGYAVYSYSSDNAANDWLISPVFTFTGNEIATIDYSAQSASYPERFQVFAINGTQSTPLTGQIDVTNTTDQTLTIDLTSLTGNYSIGFHCISDADEWDLYLTNFTVSTITGTTLSANPDMLDFSTIAMNQTSTVKEVVIQSINCSEAINLSVAAPFQISLDSNTFNTTATIPANNNMVVSTTVYVRFAPTTVGTFNQNLTASAAGTQATVALTGESVDCSAGITSFPFVYDFNTGLYPPICWGYNNAESFYAAEVDEDGDYAIGIEAADILITPEIHSDADMTLSFNYRSYFGEDATSYTTFRVGYSTTSTSSSSFTWKTPVTVTTTPDDLFFDYSTAIPANAKYAAIEVTEIGSGLYWGILEMSDVLFIDNFRLAKGVGVESLELNTKIFPNPANNVLNINANSNISCVEVFNMMGQMVGSYTANDVNTQINTTNFSNGVYMVKIDTENGTVTKKFTVAR